MGICAGGFRGVPYGATIVLLRRIFREGDRSDPQCAGRYGEVPSCQGEEKTEADHRRWRKRLNQEKVEEKME